jgi:hypothetical protein
MRRRIGRPGLVGTMARTAVITKTAQTVAGGGAAQQQANAQQAAAQQQAALDAQTQLADMQSQINSVAGVQSQPAPGGGLLAELQQLGEMLKSGLLSEEEFAAAKSKLLQA